MAECWLKTDKTSGEGNDSMHYIIDPNPCTSPRMAVVEVKNTDGTVKERITFLQDGTEKKAFYNIEMSSDFRRNDCCDAGEGTVVSYTVPAGKYTSTVSQNDADYMALMDIKANGQAYANVHGKCPIWCNVEISGEFERLDCPDGTVPCPILYVVEAGKYCSSESQSAADDLAKQDLDTNGQHWANIHGTCNDGANFESDARSVWFTRDDCEEGKFGTGVEYVVPAGAYVSQISKADANAQADADVIENGQVFANANGDCEDMPEDSYCNRLMAVTLQKNNCAKGKWGGIATYVVKCCQYYAETQAWANARAHADIMMVAQTFVNENVSCYDEEQVVYYNKRIEHKCVVMDLACNDFDYVIEARTYASMVSQEEADRLAEAEIECNCVHCHTIGEFYNVQKEITLRKNDCPDYVEGQEATFIVPAGKYFSNASQEIADLMAQNEIETHAQDWVNENAECGEGPEIYKSKEITCKKSKSDCEDGYIGSEVEFKIEEGQYTSTISQADADAKAQKEIDDNCQDYANKNGECCVKATVDASTILLSRDGGNELVPFGSMVNGSSLPFTVTVADPTIKFPTSTVVGGTADILFVQIEWAASDSEESRETSINIKNNCGQNINIKFVVPGAILYQNEEISKGFERNDCEEGFSGTTVLYVVKEGTYSSLVSQADANAKAQADIDAKGQDNANKNGECEQSVFKNVEKSKDFTRNNCNPNYSGTTVTFTVEAGKFSAASQDAADKLADDYLAENGQGYANENGECNESMWWNDAKAGTFTRNDCETGYAGQTLTYNVPANTYSSTVSKADANAKAQKDVDDNGQAYVNKNGTCSQNTFYNTAQSSSCTRNNCSTGYGNSYTYTIAANTYSSTVSIADANAKALAAAQSGCQAAANTNGTCCVNPSFSNVSVDASAISFNTSTACSYGTGSVSSNASWVSARRDTCSTAAGCLSLGGSCVSLFYTISENTTTSSRTATITFTNSCGSSTHTVTQAAACSLTMSASTFTVSATPGTYTIGTYTSTGGTPTIVSKPSWVSSVAFTGTTSGNINVTVAANSATGTLTGTLSIKNSCGSTASSSGTQSGCTLTSSVTTFTVSDAAGTYTIGTYTSTGGTPTVSSKPDWVTSVAFTGTTSGNINVTVPANSTGSVRTGTLVITNSCLKTVSMTANQSGACVLGNPPAATNVGCSAAPESSPIPHSLTGNLTGLKGTSSASWFVPTEISAANIWATRTVNATGSTRSAVVTITNSCGKSVTFTVTQNACTIGNAPATQSVAGTAGISSVSMSLTGSNTMLSAKSSASWLTVSDPTSASISLARTENATTIARSAVVTITNLCGCSVTFTVNQAANRGIVSLWSSYSLIRHFCISRVHVYSSSYTAVDYTCSNLSACNNDPSTSLCINGGNPIDYTAPAGTYNIQFTAIGVTDSGTKHTANYSTKVLVSVGQTTVVNVPIPI